MTIIMVLNLSGCGKDSSVSDSTNENKSYQTGLNKEKVITGEDGDIHFSYYLPESYDGIKEYPMIVVMPGYDRMWFGIDSS